MPYTFFYRLDERDDGSDIQQYLLEKTGQRTVPNIFISASSNVLLALESYASYSDAQHVGGSDAVAALQRDGKLKQLVQA